jgi:mannosyltransferase
MTERIRQRTDRRTATATSRGTGTALGLVVVVVVGAGIRLIGIGDKSLWIDEVFSVWTSGHSPADIIRISADLDLHPPLYYLLLHAWTLIPGPATLVDEETVTRSLSALFGIATLPLTYLIGCRIRGRALGLTAAGALALSPLQLYYAHQARMYAMLTFFGAAATLCLLHVLEPGPRLRPDRWWFGLTASTTLVMLSHNTGVLMPASAAMYLAAAARWRRRHHERSVFRPFTGSSGAATAWLAAAVLWMPWLPSLVGQVRRVDAEFWISAPSPTTVVEHWSDLASAYSDGAFHAAAALAAAVLVGIGLARGRRDGGLILMLVLVVVPPAIELLVSLRRPIFFTQTIVWTSVPFSILFAAGILSLRGRALTLVAAAAVVLFNGMGILGVHRFAGKEDWRAATGYVAQRATGSELILFSAGWSQLPFDHYYVRQDGPALVRHGLPADMFDRGILEPKMSTADVSRLEALTADRDSVWVVYSHDWYTDPSGIVPASLGARWRQADARTFPGIHVVHYALSPASPK